MRAQTAGLFVALMSVVLAGCAADPPASATAERSSADLDRMSETPLCPNRDGQTVNASAVDVHRADETYQTTGTLVVQVSASSRHDWVLPCDAFSLRVVAQWDDPAIALEWRASAPGCTEGMVVDGTSPLTLEGTNQKLRPGLACRFWVWPSGSVPPTWVEKEIHVTYEAHVAVNDSAVEPTP